MAVAIWLEPLRLLDIVADSAALSGVAFGFCRMNRLLFQMADFISRPPGFYFLMVAMARLYRGVPLGMTDIVTYGLSVLAIVISGVVLIQGYRDTAAIHAKLDEIVVALRETRNDVVGLEHSDPKEIKAVLERLEGEAARIGRCSETSSVTLPAQVNRGMAAAGLQHGPLGKKCLHVCVDMQRLFAAGGPWPIPWLERFFRRSRKPFRNMPARRCSRGLFLPTDLVKALEAGRVIIGAGPM